MSKDRLDKADFRLKTVVEYAAHHRRIIALLNTQFIKWRHAKDKTEKRDVIHEVNDLFSQSNRALSLLDGMIPGMAGLIDAEDGGQQLLDWINQDEHIDNP